MKHIIAILLLAASTFAQDFEFGIGQTEQVTRGLVSYWSMRTSGTTVYDEIGSNNGTAVNTPTFSAANGVVGNGAGLNGTDEYVSVPDSDSLSFADDPFSISVWIKMVDATGFRIAYKSDITANYYEYALSTDGSDVLFFTLFDDVGAHRISRNSSTMTGYQNAWVHIVATYDGSTASSGLHVYINGSLSDGTTAPTGTYVAMHNQPIPLTIGRVVYTDPLYANGAIDEVRIYNVALTADEIKQLYRMGATIYQNR